MKTAQALLAAGCFWGVQFYLDQVPGVTKTTCGYTGGHTKNPTYDDVCTHLTGHAESVLVEFDEDKISYETLLKQFFRMHNPTELNRQGPDVGDQYRSAIFYFDDEQKAAAEKAKHDAQTKYKQPVVTQIAKAGPFYEAEAYHQKFAERTGIGMCHIPYAPVS
ncbi:MAG TPA: peptide-methionine (S)-S-oxide reductase MsrA [Candidatus Saccharimonadales bacterium]